MEMTNFVKRAAYDLEHSNLDTIMSYYLKPYLLHKFIYTIW